MRRMWKRTLLVGVMGLLAGGAVGCAQERPAINRVQPDALAKSFFVGENLAAIEDDPEFYMRNTVVDVGYGAAQDGLFTSTYAQPVSRIRWEITEDYLNARLSYERIAGSDDKGNQIDGLRHKSLNDGQIVASYRIKSHFQIRRAYNPTTGEEQNVIEENASDLPWYERPYFRVDWSQNVATGAYDFDTLSMMGLYGGIKYSSLAYTVLDPASPDAPHFDGKDGYFDVTNKAYAEPSLIDLSSLGWGIDTFPACYLPGEFAGGTYPYGNCNPVEITLRQSFRKVVDKDYEPQDQDGFRFQSFGIFVTERTGYDRNYGMIDDKWHRFASRYNIWERSHFYKNPDTMEGPIVCGRDSNPNPNADGDGNGTADVCEAAGAGSRCDVFRGACTLPYRSRKAVTIPWYYNGRPSQQLAETLHQIEALQAQATALKGSDDSEKIASITSQIESLLKEIDKAGVDKDDLFEATDWSTQEWDIAMRTAVQTARLAECRKTGGQGCETQFPMWIGQQDDIDEAADINREVTACERKNGYGKCDAVLQGRIDRLRAERPGDDANTDAIAAILRMQPVIVLCHDPVLASDHPACDPRSEEQRTEPVTGTAVPLAPRLGDIRYNLVLAIDKPQSPSAWGIMVDGDDPLTGEKINASINIWTHITDVAATGLLDVVRYVNGELPIEEITNGTYVSNWAGANKYSNGATMSKQEITNRLASSTKLDPKTFETFTKNASPALKEWVQRSAKELNDVAIAADAPSSARADVALRMKRARGSNVEAKLLNPATLQVAGIGGAVPVDGVMADVASPFALNNPAIRSQMSKMREIALADRGACILNEAPEPTSVPALAAILKEKFPYDPATETADGKQARYDAMLRYIQRRYQYAVIGHEMGHSIGLRHNFVSTSAALFFRPQYWQLRTRNKAVTTECTDAQTLAEAENCIGPRYYDPITANEEDQMIWMFQHSSVMDYPGDVSQDMLGLGAYDFAAARFFYGDVASVYADPKFKAGTVLGVGITNATDTFGGLAGIRYGTKANTAGQGTNDFHYSLLDRKYGVIQDCYDFTPQQPSDWRPEVDGIWHPLLDGKVVTVGGKTQKCRQAKVDYGFYGDLRMPTEKEINAPFYRGGPSVDQTGRTRVPYAFATDRWADTGNVSVFRHDNGADPYEVVMYLLSNQETRHIFDNYRRNRMTFNIRAAADRSWARYMEKLLGIGGGLGLYVGIYQDLATNQGIAFDQLWPLFTAPDGGFAKDNIIAATVAMDHFTRLLGRPQTGGHYLRSADYNDPVYHSESDGDDYGPEFGFGGPFKDNGKIAFNIPNGATGLLKDVSYGGHPLENAFADGHGEYDVDYTQNVGSYYNKINTAILFSESEDRFISSSRRDFYDARFRAVGMADVLPEGYRRIIANVLTNDRSIFAPRVALNASGKPDVASGSLFPNKPLGWPSMWPSASPEVCFSQNGSNICSPFSGSTNPFLPPGTTALQGVPVDPQIGWEVQKFMIAWTLAHIPANQKTDWTDMMRLYRLGPDNAPEVQARIEWQDPVSGEIFYARTYGKECLFGVVTPPANPNGMTSQQIEKAKGDSCVASGGKWVQKGIAARVLEYANWLTSKGYQLDVSGYPNNQPDEVNQPPGFSKYGRAMVMYQPDGSPIVVPDPAILDIVNNPAGGPYPPCDQNADPTCTPLSIFANHYAYELKSYKSVPSYLWETGVTMGLWGSPHELGLYP